VTKQKQNMLKAIEFSHEICFGQKIEKNTLLNVLGCKVIF